MPVLIAFDLDGVLYSSEPFLAEAYRDAIDAVHALRPGSFRRIPSRDEILRYVGWPVDAILTGLFPDAAPEAIRLLRRVSLDVICKRVARGDGIVYPGVPETLERLAREGHTMVIASNGRRQYVETVLRSHGLARWFAPLLSLDGEGLPDKTALLRAYLQRHRIEPEDAVLVGDRASDVAAAAAVGCAFVGCAYGHGGGAEVEGRGPVVDSFSELPCALAATRREQRLRCSSRGGAR